MSLAAIARRSLPPGVRTIVSMYRPPNWKALAPAPLPGVTFAAQNNLPKLLVPELSDTLIKLKETLKPFARNEYQYGETVKLIDEFERGLGPKLQERLIERKDETQHWLEEWWDDDAYLKYRDSVVINVSYYYGFREHPSHLSQTAVARAAILTRAVMLFRQQFRLGLLKPESTKEGPICMDSWRWMFDACRIPGSQADWSVSYAKKGDKGDSGHVVVLRKGRVWKIDAWQGGQLLSTDDIQAQFQHIYDNSTREYPPVGLMTGSDRDSWAKDYMALAADPHNSDILEAIHSSAFIVCLDDERPSGMKEISRALWHGAVTTLDDNTILGMRNRWVDKPCQFIVFDNGTAGFMGEHSAMDGTPTATMCDRVLDMVADTNFAHGTSSTNAEPPVALDWHVSDATIDSIARAQKELLGLIGGQTMGIVRIDYGKAAIKHFGVSPDSWAQMLIQLAYVRLLKANKQERPGATYESASTRRFLKGRTEVIRVVSSESDAWVAAMLSPASSVQERKTLFAAASKKHIERAKLAGNGLGVDRHLHGLKKLLQANEELPKLFVDPIFEQSSKWVLSTSAVFSKHFGPYGWGEVVPDGFGVAYMTGFDDYLQFTVTSRENMPNKQFCEELTQAASDLFDLFTPQIDKVAKL